MRFDPMEPGNISFCDHHYVDHNLRLMVHWEMTDIFMLSIITGKCSSTILSPVGKRLGDYCFTQPIIGLDQCIYWPQTQNTKRVLKFDPSTQQPPSYVGPNNIITNWNNQDWIGGALASDGVIYCAPFLSNRVLAIDPLRELSMKNERNDNPLSR
jgi:hypothetical protein